MTDEKFFEGINFLDEPSSSCASVASTRGDEGKNEIDPYSTGSASYSSSASPPTHSETKSFPLDFTVPINLGDSRGLTDTSDKRAMASKKKGSRKKKQKQTLISQYTAGMEAEELKLEGILVKNIKQDELRPSFVAGEIKTFKASGIHDWALMSYGWFLSSYKDNTPEAKQYFVKNVFEAEKSLYLDPYGKKRKHRA